MKYQYAISRNAYIETVSIYNMWIENKYSYIISSISVKWNISSINVNVNISLICVIAY